MKVGATNGTIGVSLIKAIQFIPNWNPIKSLFFRIETSDHSNL